MQSYRHEKIAENQDLPVRFLVTGASNIIFPAHWHDYVEILCLLSGELTAVVQAETYDMHPGDLLIINARDLHQTQTRKDAVYILLQISSDQMRGFFHDFEYLRFQTHIIPLSSQEPGKIFESIGEMKDLYQKKTEGYQLLFISRLYEFLYYLYRQHSFRLETPKNLEDRDFRRIQKVMEWVRDHYTENLSLDEAAALLGLSREYFCRLFKKYTGQTFLEYVNAIRVMQLHEDLKSSGLSITQLMEKHGIHNYKVFMRTFKKLYGDTPQNVRRNLKRSTPAQEENDGIFI